MNGDTFFDVDPLTTERESAPLVVAVKRMKKFSRYGTVIQIEDGRIQAFRKQPCDEGLINGGIYLVNRTILEDYPKDKFSFENEILETKTAEIEMAAVESEGYFIDIGIPEDTPQHRKR
ncbi:MAG: hypothetical protein ACLS2X_04030 [Coprococcus sp.]